MTAILPALPAPPADGLAKATLRTGSGQAIKLGGYGRFEQDQAPLLDSAGALSYLPTLTNSTNREHLLATPRAAFTSTAPGRQPRMA